MMQRLMKDENFRALMNHPKVQELMRDPEFIEIAKKQDFSVMMTHPKFAGLLGDPELQQLFLRMKPQNPA
jgi:predicted double-glycine peptidase